MEKIFGDLNEKEVRKIEKIADKVMALDEQTAALTDEQLRVADVLKGTSVELDIGKTSRNRYVFIR